MSETVVTTEGSVEVTDDLDAFSDDFFGRKSEAKEKSDETKPEAEQDTDEQTQDDTEAQKTDDEVKDDEELKEEIPETPKRKTVQDRIDEVVRQREDLRRESEAQIQKLRQELEDFKKSQTPEKVQEAKAEEPAPDAEDKNGDPIYPLGEFDPQYIRDLTRFTLAQERAAAEVIRAKTEQEFVAKQTQEALMTQWNAKMETATKDYPDFNEKGKEFLEGFDNLNSDYAGYLANVLMSMDKGPDVLYYLANHPDEATEIVNSGAQRATLALGRIESRFMQSEKEAPKPKVSKAPAPPSERTRGTNGAFISVAPDTDDLDAFTQEFFSKKKR